MLYDPSTVQHLKPWLVRTLEPICDAEPGALAEYVLALLKHNVPESEMRKELSAQLEEFLEKECSSFIDTLFTVLRTKSYLPYTANSPPPTHPSSLNGQPGDGGIPIPLDSFLSNNSTSPERGQKRSHDNDDRDAQRPAKGPRLSADGQLSRYSNGRDGRSTGQWGGRFDRNDRQGMVGGANGMGQGMNGGMSNVNGRRIQTYQPPDQRKGICRDYHNNGYCARGALCKYSHGDDAFIPSQLFPMGPTGAQMPFLPMFANGGMPFAIAGPGAAYDPNEARMDMRPNGNVVGMNGRGGPHQRAPVMPRAQQEDSLHTTRASGELPVIQDLTPQIPEDPSANPQSQDSRTAPNGAHIPAPYQPQTANMDVDMSAPAPSSQDTARGGFGGGGRGAPRGGGRGTFFGDAQSFRPERRNDKTLVVEKIPEDKLSLDAVNSWFKRFGTVTNVAIDARSAKALVSFSEHSEAHAAWKSEDAVFSNRFVKVFWHRPMEGHGQKGTRMLAASGPLVANITARNTNPPTFVPATTVTAPPAETPAAVPARKQSVPATAASDLAAKQKLLEQQIGEQKSLMASLATASGEEKKVIMARLRKLGEEMKPSPSPAPTPAPAPAQSPPPSATQRPAPQLDEHEKKLRERLDKELELHAATGGESTEDLQTKLAKLKEEAASLGIQEATEQPYSGGPYRPYRGRGRGARSTFFRGAMRGGPPRVNMKLDNRPRKLLVKGVRADAIQAVREWYETTGQVDSVDSAGDGEVVVGFRTRAAAEQALAKGTDLPSVGPVQISWHTGQPSAPSSQAPPATASSQPESKAQKTPTEVRAPSPPRQGHHSPRRVEEEVVASGWGDGDEDDMGF
ncbi:hypothetical protein HYDPIDRAFT_107002 [Hydnomerulius pinastri MD-312]|nr:hypothetical protein HYDPIDRAFT_107002 [Hydnomerulius pinastri MD-312]